MTASVISLDDPQPVRELIDGYLDGRDELTGLDLYYALERSTSLLTFHTMLRGGPRNRARSGLQQSYGIWVARAFIPHAQKVLAFSRDGKPLGELTRRDEAGFFEGRVAVEGRQPIRYRASNEGGEWDVFDPYSFGPVLGPMDDYYINEGTHLRLFDKLDVRCNLAIHGPLDESGVAESPDSAQRMLVSILKQKPVTLL